MSLHGQDFSLGSPPLTPRRGRRAGIESRSSGVRLVDLTSPSLPYPMSNKQPSFAERCRDMHDAAEQLKSIADIVALEAIHMAAASKRFSERQSDKRKPSR